MPALETLSGEPRWVAWRCESRGGKPTKVPYSPCGRKAKANDPSSWGNRAAAEACAARIVNGSGGGVGIQLGDLRADLHLGGIDLDSCISDDGVIAPWAAAILSETPTYTERSPSGHGVKLFFYAPTEDVRPFLDRIGVAPDAWGTRRGVPGHDGRNHGPAIEVYLAGRYFAVTGDRWPEAPDTLATLDKAALDQLAGLIPAAGSAGHKDGADGSRSAVAFRTGLAMRRAGGSYEEFCKAIRTDPRTSSWYSEKGIAAGGRELQRIWRKAEARRPASTAEWLPETQQDRQNEPRPNLFNAMLALREDARLNDLFSYDEMLRAVILLCPVPGGGPDPGREAFKPRPVRDADVAAVQESCKLPDLRKSAKTPFTKPSTCVPTSADFTPSAIT